MIIDFLPPPETYINDGPYPLDKLVIPEVHVENGRELSVTYQLKCTARPMMSKRWRNLALTGVFTRLLKNHGTAIIRDTAENSDTSKAPRLAENFRITEENRGLVEFQQGSTRSLRTKKCHNLYVANTLHPVPAGQRIHQHNVYSRFKFLPTANDFNW